MNPIYHIFTINPGSTSTKLALFINDQEMFSEVIRHQPHELAEYPDILSQKDYRQCLVKAFLKKHIKPEQLDAVVGRGGMLKSIPSGTYEVNMTMLADLKAGVGGQHASNLGGILAYEIAMEANCPAYIVDPVVVDEMIPEAKLTGIPEIKRRSVFHALNQRAVALKWAKDHHRDYETCTLIVAHMGGGISIGLHHDGRVIDVNNALDGDGPIAPQRAGSIPAGQLAEWCNQGKFRVDQLLGKGGISAHLLTHDMEKIMERVEQGSRSDQLVVDAMIYQIAKSIGALAAAAKGHVDAILLTGGLAHNQSLMQAITQSVQWIAPVHIYPGEMEMEALAGGAFRVLKGEDTVQIY